MGLFTALKGLVSPVSFGESIIEAQYKTYQKIVRDWGVGHHEALCQTLLARWRARGMESGTKDAAMRAFMDTYQFACLPPPSAVRALGLFLIYKERPEVIEMVPKFAAEYEVLMRDVVAAQKIGLLDDLYNSMNPSKE